MIDEAGVKESRKLTAEMPSNMGECHLSEAALTELINWMHARYMYFFENSSRISVS